MRPARTFVNLAGIEDADIFIQEELALAGINMVHSGKERTEVPCTITGRLGDWTFKRAWYYWMASVSENEKIKGLPLEIASQMHEKKYPVAGVKNQTIYGDVIRVIGHCGRPHPKEYQNLYDNLGKRLVYDPEGEQETFFINHFSKEDASKFTFVKTSEDLEKKTVKSFIDSYHIDTQLGLNEFTRVLRDFYKKTAVDSVFFV